MCAFYGAIKTESCGSETSHVGQLSGGSSLYVSLEVQTVLLTSEYLCDLNGGSWHQSLGNYVKDTSF